VTRKPKVFRKICKLYSMLKKSKECYWELCDLGLWTWTRVGLKTTRRCKRPQKVQFLPLNDNVFCRCCYYCCSISTNCLWYSYRNEMICWRTHARPLLALFHDDKDTMSLFVWLFVVTIIEWHTRDSAFCPLPRISPMMMMEDGVALWHLLRSMFRERNSLPMWTQTPRRTSVVTLEFFSSKIVLSSSSHSLGSSLCDIFGQGYNMTKAPTIPMCLSLAKEPHIEHLAFNFVDHLTSYNCTISI